MAEQFSSEKSRKEKSPVLAAFLAIIPGLGSLYNGNLIKAIGIIILFVFFIAMIDRSYLGDDEAILGISLGIFYIYQILDSYKEASQKCISTLNKKAAAPEKVSLFWAVLVLGLGIVFQLANLGLFRHQYIIRYWPVLLIAFGVKLVFDYLKKEKEGHNENR